MKILHKKNRPLVILVLGLLVCLVVISSWLPPEPFYKGRSLEAWTKDLCFLEGGKDTRTTAMRSRHEQAVAAIRQMGSKVVLPVALKRCQSENIEKQAEGGDALWALGSLAEPAIPDLMEMLKSRNPEIAASASYALRGVGTNVVPPVAAFLNDPNLNDANRVAAMMVLGYFGSEAKSAIPPLNECLKSSNPAVSNFAARVLRRIKTIPVQTDPPIK